MDRTRSVATLLIAASAVAVSTDARGDTPSAYSYAWHDDRLSSGIGVSTVIGFGVTGFTGKEMRDDTQANGAGGVWDLRVTLGSHTPVALDINYFGTSTNTKQLFAGQDATIIGSSIEGALRYNVLPHATWNPYAFAGVGWQRYDLTGGTFDVMNTSNNSLEFPLGGGIEYRDPDGFVLDVRGTFRSSADGALLRETNGTAATMDTWEASASIGYEL
jgi:hypothetical protein